MWGINSAQPFACICSRRKVEAGIRVPCIYGANTKKVHGHKYMIGYSKSKSTGLIIGIQTVKTVCRLCLVGDDGMRQLSEFN